MAIQSQFDFSDPDVRQAYKNVFAKENGFDLSDPDVNSLLDQQLDAMVPAAKSWTEQAKEATRNIPTTVKTIGKGIKNAAVYGLPAMAARAYEETFDENPRSKENLADWLIEREKQHYAETADQTGEDRRTAFPPVPFILPEGMTQQDVIEATKSAPFSGVGLIGGLAGRAAGLATPVPGGAAAGAIAGSSLALTPVAKNTIERQLIDAFEQQKGARLTEEEAAALLADFDSSIKRHVAGEVLPEAIGNAFEIGFLSKMIGKTPAGQGLLKTIASKAFEGIKSLGVELAGETTTTQIQQPAEVEMGLRNEAPRSMTSLEDWGTSYKEVAPQVVAMQAGMGGGASALGLMRGTEPKVYKKLGEIGQDLIVSHNVEPVQIYRDQPQEAVTPSPVISDEEAAQFEQEARRQPPPDLMADIIGTQQDVQQQDAERTAARRMEPEWSQQQQAAQEYTSKRNQPNLGWAYESPQAINSKATNAKIDNEIAGYEPAPPSTSKKLAAAVGKPWSISTVSGRELTEEQKIKQVVTDSVGQKLDVAKAFENKGKPDVAAKLKQEAFDNAQKLVDADGQVTEQAVMDELERAKAVPLQKEKVKTSESAQKDIDDEMDRLLKKFTFEEVINAQTNKNLPDNLKVKTPVTDSDINKLEELYAVRDKIDKKDLTYFFDTIVKDTGIDKTEAISALKKIGIHKDTDLSVSLTSETLKDIGKQIPYHLADLYSHFAKKDSSGSPLEFAEFRWGGSGSNPILEGRAFNDDLKTVAWNKEALRKTEKIYNAIAKNRGIHPINLQKIKQQNKAAQPSASKATQESGGELIAPAVRQASKTSEGKDDTIQRNKDRVDTAREAKTAQAVEEKTQRVKKESAEVKGKQEPLTNDKEKIDDFGEKLGGARKDLAKSFNRELSDDDISSLPLSKIWPKEEIEEIEDVNKAAVAFAIREEIPNKPRQKYKVQRWVDTVKSLRGIMRHYDRIGNDALIDKMGSKQSLKNIVNKIKVLTEIDRKEWGRIGEVFDYPNAFIYDENNQKKSAPSALVKVDGSYARGISLDDAIAKAKERLQGERETKNIKFELRKNISTGKFFFNKEGDPLKRKLKEFDTKEEAYNYRRDNYNDLVAEWENIKATQNIKKSDVRGKENRPRKGNDHRMGKDVTAEMFQDTFGFRGVEFGLWLKQGKGSKDRQGMLNLAYDALYDLANIINIPTKAISLNGSLGLGLGSRGHGAAAAHYEPGTLVINLTKPSGAGSLAHEWFHALDNYFQRERGPTGVKRETSYVTYQPETRYRHKVTGHTLSAQRTKEIQKNGRININDWDIVTGIRPEVEEAFSDLVKALDESPMKKRADLIGKGKSDNYWGRVIERAARSFENYVITKMQLDGYHNDFLANVVPIEAWAMDQKRYPYLLVDEIAPVSEAFDNLFSTIKTKETDKGTALYSRSTTTGQTVDAVKAAVSKNANARRMIEAGKLKIVESVEELPRGSKPLYMTAWHGSPHKFDKFSTENIGSGEGAQAYGYGLYFASKKEIAEWYKENLQAQDVVFKYKGEELFFDDYEGQSVTDNELTDLALFFVSNFESISDAISSIKTGDHSFDTDYWNFSEKKVEKEIYRLLKNGDISFEYPDKSGALYEVELAPAEDEFLLWDKPLSEQSVLLDRTKAKIKDEQSNIYKRVNSGNKIIFENGETELARTDFFKKVLDSKSYMTGGEFYRFLSNKYTPEETSNILHSLGIRGIKYLDGTSRAKGEGAYNYVIFSDEDVSIKARYSKQNRQIAGAYYPNTDTMYLVAESIAKGEELPTAYHESFHRAVEKGEVKPILDELGGLEKMAGAKSAIAEWFTKAREAAQVDKDSNSYIDEIGAYAVQWYESAPNTIKKWVEKLIAKVKYTLFNTFGVMPKNLTPAFLREVALSGLKVGTVKESLQVGAVAPVYSQIAKEYGITVEEAKRQYDAVVKKYKGTAEWMKAPNGEPTKLNERQWVQTRTPAFKEWFGDWENDPKNSSKVIDENGDPLVVYHGTPSNNIKSFSLKVAGTGPITGNPIAKHGIFFAPSAEYASFYAENNGSVIPVFLKLNKPFSFNMWKDGMNLSDKNGVMVSEKVDPFIEKIKNKHNDGIVLGDKGFPKEYMVFSPKQIKSAISNTGQFGQTDDIRYSQKQIQETTTPSSYPLFSRVDINQQMEEQTNDLWEVPDKSTKWESLQWYLQDKLDPLKRVQEKIGPVPEEMDALLKAKLQIAKSKAAIDDFEQLHVDPLLKDIKKSGLKLEDVENYVYAKHVHLDKVNERLSQINAKRYLNDLVNLKEGREARKLKQKIEDLEFEYDFDSPDRKKAYVSLLENSFDESKEGEERLQSRWKSFSEKPSGMTNKEASEIYAGKTPDLERISERISAINEFRVNTLLNAGIISAEEAKAWRGAYKHYVPLKREGFPEKRLPVGRGISDLSKGSKVRMGSTRRAENIIANSIAAAEQSIIRDKKAETMRALVSLIKAYPNPDFWAVEKSKKSPGYDSHGNIRMYTTQEDGDNIIQARINGERYVIRFQEDSVPGIRIAQALKNDMHQHGPIVNALSIVTRLLAQVNTSWSPEFPISNFARDIQTAAYNISDTDADKLKKQIIIDVRKSMPGIWKAIGGDTTSEWSKWFKDFQKHGGQVSWLSDYASVEKTAKNIAAEIKSGTDVNFMARQKLKGLGELVSKANNSIENAVRLSFYKNAVESRLMTRERAALAAKELTTNFETKGSAGQTINALYMFANAGVQGSTRIIRAIKRSKKVRIMVGSTIFAGMAMDVFSRAMGGDDDDGQAFYDKVPQYIKERNIVIMKSNGGYIKIPLPWGYNLFWNIGAELGRSFTEEKFKPTESAARIAITAINAFNPIQAATFAQTLAPTIADPFVQIIENKSWSGTPLKPENSPFDKVPKPEYQMYWRSARPTSKYIAKALNDLTGGNEIKPGFVNWSPEWIDNMYDTVTGSLGRFVADSVGVPYKIATGQEVEIKEIPFARKIIGSKSEAIDQSLYHERVKEILLDKKMFKEKPEMREEIKNKYKNFQLLIFVTDKSEKRLRELRKLKKSSGKNDKVDKYMDKVYDNFNRSYNKSTR